DAADYNNDGFRDMISSWATSFNTMSGADVSINDTRHGFYEEVSYASPAALSDMKAGDFNGDGKADAVTAHGYNSRKLAVYFGNATGSLATPITTSFSEALNKIIVGDFNRDGKDDAFVVDAASRGYCMLSTGNGTFTIGANSPITLPDSNPGLQKGDFNNDEKLDLIITGGGSVKLWLGDGMGQFTQSAAVIPAVGNIAPGDINGDGNLDLVGTTAPSGSLPPWRTDNAVVGILGNGNASFGTPFSKNIPNFSHNTTTSLVTGDFNFDGFDDAAMIEPENTFGNLIVVFSGGSSPSWREPMFPGVGPATRTLLVADFDSDGRSDIEYLGDNARGVIYNTGGAVARKPPFDFDGDGKTDVGIYRPNGANGAEWWINRSATDTLFATQFGAPTDKVVSVDFTGDGKADVAFWRPSTGFWYVLRSEDLSYFAVPFGSNGDIPVPADYDGDGKADRAVFRPSNTTWYIDQSGGGTRIESFGSAGDKPVPADYDGDGKADMAIFRPTGGSGSGEWWINRSTAGLQALVFGVSTDKPVQGDYTGDGKADIAFWRPSTGQWFVLRSENLTYYATPFGNGTDIPSPGDYDGDGKFDPAIYRPSETNWYVQRSTAGLLIRQFGAAGDQPLPNSFVP
ncbi:MAG TPA: VCBS repeat-containing protein, partial [Pyrinomonadaceae bacterium]|nr:VCBS repeat-containing protein [Pyrinomonadaceae bacterium]